MQLGVLITNHGKHSNEKLAIACGTDIVGNIAMVLGKQAIDGRKLENRISEIAEQFFAKIAEFEHAGIDAKGTAHLSSSQEVHPEVLDAAVQSIVAAVKESPFASEFTPESVESNVRAVLSQRLGQAHHMHRDWFARHGKVGHGTELEDSDKHDPNSEHVKRWIAAA